MPKVKIQCLKLEKTITYNQIPFTYPFSFTRTDTDTDTNTNSYQGCQPRTMATRTAVNPRKSIFR
jgi:hypothetical protein